jgi:hypothetical protein
MVPRAPFVIAQPPSDAGGGSGVIGQKQVMPSSADGSVQHWKATGIPCSDPQGAGMT